jgi:hypothetical protein
MEGREKQLLSKNYNIFLFSVFFSIITLDGGAKINDILNHQSQNAPHLSRSARIQKCTLRYLRKLNTGK